MEKFLERHQYLIMTTMIILYAGSLLVMVISFPQELLDGVYTKIDEQFQIQNERIDELCTKKP